MGNWVLAILTTLLWGCMLTILLATFLWGCIITILLVYCKRKGRIGKYLGFSGIVLIYLVCNIGIFLSFAFGGRDAIKLPVIFHDFLRMIKINTYSIANIEFRMIDLLMIVWLVGAVISLVRYLAKYLYTARVISKVQKDSERYEKVLERIKVETKSSLNVTVCSGEHIQTPCSIGLVKKKILLPKQEFSEDELYHICKHEYTHLKNGDLWIKFLLQICCCLMWWNPLSHWLKRELGRTLEIRCDLSVTSEMKDVEKAEYLQTILNCLRKQRKGLFFHNASAMVGQSYGRELEERFCIVARENAEQKKQMKYAKILIIVLMISVVLSYAYVL